MKLANGLLAMMTSIFYEPTYRTTQAIIATRYYHSGAEYLQSWLESQIKGRSSQSFDSIVQGNEMKIRPLIAAVSRITFHAIPSSLVYRFSRFWRATHSIMAKRRASWRMHKYVPRTTTFLDVWKVSTDFMHTQCKSDRHVWRILYRFLGLRFSHQPFQTFASFLFSLNFFIAVFFSTLLTTSNDSSIDKRTL